ncbi:MAG: hypothetical protein R3C49_05685 [Planctomycetaceae bacterium]
MSTHLILSTDGKTLSADGAITELAADSQGRLEAVPSLVRHIPRFAASLIVA